VPEEEDDEVGVVVDLVVVVVELEELAAPPHAAARSPSATMATPTPKRRRFLEDVARCHARWSGDTSWVCSRVLMPTILARRPVALLLRSCSFL
jgi:hypothetical protein